MDYLTSVGDLRSKNYLELVRKIRTAKNNFIKEKYFKKMARHILRREGFIKVTEGPSISEFQGVPFDFIAVKNGVLSLIELKGSANSFNYSKDVQFARLYQVTKELKKRKIRHRTFLLQINLKYALYQMLGEGFHKALFRKIDQSLGKKRPIVPIVDDLLSRMRRKRVKV